ncbi:MAG: homoserine kinase [Solirubrobacterales bacterium]
MERRRLVRVPASSANLGPGYDVLAAALQLALEVEVEETGEFGVEAEGLDVPLDRSNLVVSAYESLKPADGVTFRIRSEIPPARGLGSSAAAIVAGLVAADHLHELALSREELLYKAAEIEGHPDNVAAAIYGGFVICDELGGRPAATRFDPPGGIEGVLVIPTEEVPTAEARAAIPAEVPLGDAVANISAAALLVLGLRNADLNLIERGLADRIHQPRRAALYPDSMQLLASAAETGAIGATISGAGPSVLVWANWQETGQIVEALNQQVGDWAEVRRVPFAALGADVPEL